jgi:glycerol-3-phosphate dehydrogenase
VDGVVDIFIIGGGINGCGIARDAVGRGYSVYLAEMNDLASGTSSASTKLIHGGLRYLEHYEFRLVRESLMEREVIWRNAPHIVWPMRFVLPHHKGLRPAWLLRLGLFMYDHLGGRKLLPGTRTLDMNSDPAAKPLKSCSARRSNIPIAGSMMPVSSFSTRGTLLIAARRSARAQKSLKFAGKARTGTCRFRMSSRARSRR